MIATTNPPESEPEPEPEPTASSAGPTHRPDRYVDDKFLEIFRHEDRDGEFARLVTEYLSQNDSGWAPITSWRAWWQRGKRAEDH